MVMFQKTDPVGVIDSGIGGFSVARQLQRLLPGEELIYLGDGANVPYGNHSRGEIVALSRRLFRYMERRGVKALMVACNTISCVADDCAEEVSCPFFSVVRAGAEAAAALEAKKVGVISTVFTHKTQCYTREIVVRRPRTMKVVSHGCEDLAALVEHSLGDPGEMGKVEADIRREVEPLVRRDGIEALVLGCTHFPLVQDSIQKLFPGLLLLDPAEEMARELRAYLEKEDLLNDGERPGGLEIITTGSVEEYELQAGLVGLERVRSVTRRPPEDL